MTDAAGPGPEPGPAPWSDPEPGPAPGAQADYSDDLQVVYISGWSPDPPNIDARLSSDTRSVVIHCSGGVGGFLVDYSHVDLVCTATPGGRKDQQLGAVKAHSYKQFDLSLTVPLPALPAHIEVEVSVKTPDDEWGHRSRGFDIQ